MARTIHKAILIKEMLILLTLEVKVNSIGPKTVDRIKVHIMGLIIHREIQGLHMAMNGINIISKITHHMEDHRWAQTHKIINSLVSNNKIILFSNLREDIVMYKIHMDSN